MGAVNSGVGYVLLMTPRTVRIRKAPLHEAQDDDLLVLSPAERIAMVWPLTRDAWIFAAAGGTTSMTHVESRLSRHIVSVQRRAR